MSARLPYLEKVGGVYYFRRRLPGGTWFGLKSGVLRFSLHTKDRQQAVESMLRCCMWFEKFKSLPLGEAAEAVSFHIIRILKSTEDPTELELHEALEFIGIAAKILRRAEDELPDYDNRFPLMRPLLGEMATKVGLQKYSYDMLKLMEEKEHKRKLEEAKIKIADSLDSLPESFQSAMKEFSRIIESSTKISNRKIGTTNNIDCEMASLSSDNSEKSDKAKI